MVNLATFERVPGHSSETASTTHEISPGGSAFVVEVSLVLSMSTNAPPLSDAKTRYSWALATALQTSVTGEATFAAPSAGETIIGASPLHVAAPVATVNVERAESSGVQPSKNVSTYQTAGPFGIVVWSFVSVVTPTSEKGSLFDDTQTR